MWVMSSGNQQVPQLLIALRDFTDIITPTMKFEFDTEKNNSNKGKHGIDFYEAQELWDDPDYIEIPAKTVDERRFLVIGKIDGKHFSGVITYREDIIKDNFNKAVQKRGD